MGGFDGAELPLARQSFWPTTKLVQPELTSGFKEIRSSKEMPLALAMAQQLSPGLTVAVFSHLPGVGVAVGVAVVLHSVVVVVGLSPETATQMEFPAIKLVQPWLMPEL